MSQGDARAAGALQGEPGAPDAAHRRRVDVLRALVLAGVAALVLLGLAWELWLAPVGSRGWLALKVLPLAPGIGGLVRHRLSSYRALSLLVWLYVLEGLVRVTTEGEPVRTLAAVEVLTAVALFACCAVYVRQRLKGAACPSA